jgi:hypothetical protein
MDKKILLQSNPMWVAGGGYSWRGVYLRICGTIFGDLALCECSSISQRPAVPYPERPVFAAWGVAASRALFWPRPSLLLRTGAMPPDRRRLLW